MTSSIQSFGRWVRQRRRERALTQKALGRMIGYAEITVRQIEHDSYNLTRFVVECLINGLADEDDDREALLHFALAQSASSNPRPHHPYVYPSGTPFYGRDAELAYLSRLLNNPECRCVSIVGVGGVGKTRLALRALELVDDRLFSDVQFVNLTAITSVEFIPSAAAEALGISLNPFTPALDQLLQQLQTRSSLILFDNFEQLLPDGLPLIQAIMTHAPRVKVLITSRERLNMGGEWCIRLEGLDTSDKPSTISEAAALFIGTAQRINNHFDAADLNTILEICRLVQGNPLAIEMAASWTEVHSCAEILAGISTQMLGLTTRQRGVDDRHRSLGVVFEVTWAKLSVEEQTTLKQLSIFRDGFTAEAAKVTAHTTTEILAFLQDKMLIQRQEARRFVLHEMIRQLAFQKLAVDGQALHEARLAHAGYFVDWLKDSPERLEFRHTKAEILRLMSEMENLRVMWTTICEEQITAWFWRTWEVFWLFFNITSHFQEGERLFAVSSASFDHSLQASETFRAWSYSQILCAHLIFRQGRIPEARNILSDPDMDVIRSNVGNPIDQYWIHGAESYVYHAMGEIPAMLASTAALEKAIENLPESPYHVASAHLQMGRAKHLAGDKASAYQALAESLRICRERGSVWAGGLILTEIGFIAEADGRMGDALDYYEAALTTTTQFEEWWNYQRTQISIGRVRLALGQVKEAVSIQKITLQTLLATPSLGLEIDCFVEVALILMHFGEGALAIVLLEYCAAHPECFQPVRDRAMAYLASMRAETPEPDVAAARFLFPSSKAEVATLLLGRLGERAGNSA